MTQQDSAIRLYAGDVDSATAWHRLANDPEAVLLDVRTRAEWTFVGVPELGRLDKETRFVEWQSYPEMQVNQHFVEDVAAAGVTPAQSLYLICRSGARSARAATALTAAGYARCFNVADGFEGPHDSEGHRGTNVGWKAAGLPWRQG